MQKQRRSVVKGLCALTGGAALGFPAIATARKKEAPVSTAQLEAALHQAVAKGAPGVSAAIANKRGVIWTGVAGFAEDLGELIAFFAEDQAELFGGVIAQAAADFPAVGVADEQDVVDVLEETQVDVDEMVRHLFHEKHRLLTGTKDHLINDLSAV